MFDNYLWIGTENTSTGTEIWKYNGSSWSKANADGFGHSNHRRTHDFAIYNNKLYAVGEYGDVMRWNSGTSWTNVNNTYSKTNLSAESFNGKLFVGTRDTSLSCQIWSYNGSSWTQENSNGFGDANNRDLQSMAIFDSRLYVGTFNFTGAQVWKSGGTAPSPPKKKAVYLAEGTTDYGFSTYISIQNPNSSAVPADITYMTNTGAVSGGTINLPANSQTTVNLSGALVEVTNMAR